MSYAQHVRHARNHRKDRKAQPVIMSTGSGFWPSGAFLERWNEHVAECKARGEQPMGCEDYYNSALYRGQP